MLNNFNKRFLVSLRDMKKEEFEKHFNKLQRAYKEAQEFSDAQLRHLASFLNKNSKMAITKPSVNIFY